jgi:hypothetical protein
VSSVYYLSAGQPADTRRTWANQSFETESGKPEGTVVEEPLHNGVVSIDASSVALICFK